MNPIAWHTEEWACSPLTNRLGRDAYSYSIRPRIKHKCLFCTVEEVRDVAAVEETVQILQEDIILDLKIEQPRRGQGRRKGE